MPAHKGAQDDGGRKYDEEGGGVGSVRYAVGVESVLATGGMPRVA